MILTVRIMIIQIGDHYSFIGDDDDADDEQDDDVFEIRRTIGEQRFARHRIFIKSWQNHSCSNLILFGTTFSFGLFQSKLFMS